MGESMKTIVVTGSTRGIGYGLADAFLGRGCQVVISGRKQASVDQAVAILGEKYNLEKILGYPCDVSDYGQVKTLWEMSINRFGQVDIWVNNAGQGQAIQDFWTLDPEHISDVVQINMTGTMYGTKVAIEGMLKQGFGALYIMEGAGSTGRIHTGMILYGSTKRGLNYFIEGLAQETKGTPVIVGGLSPGMVLTDLYQHQRDRDPEGWERTKRILNIMADRIETVTPWLVDRMLENKNNGADIRWASRGKIMWRFLTAPFVKRDLFGDE
jgi:NAD(P)-dependent dehydrogenase (short-subunit alcohol dehydrogenase family)